MASRARAPDAGAAAPRERWSLLPTRHVRFPHLPSPLGERAGPLSMLLGGTDRKDKSRGPDEEATNADRTVILVRQNWPLRRPRWAGNRDGPGPNRTSRPDARESRGSPDPVDSLRQRPLPPGGDLDAALVEVGGKTLGAERPDHLVEESVSRSNVGGVRVPDVHLEHALVA